MALLLPPPLYNGAVTSIVTTAIVIAKESGGDATKPQCLIIRYNGLFDGKISQTAQIEFHGIL